MTPREELAKAIEAADRASEVVTELRERIAGLERDLTPAREALASAESELNAALGAAALGESSPKVTQTARDKRAAADERARGLKAARDVLRQRAETAEALALAAQTTARNVAEGFAKELAPVELKRAQQAAVELADALHRWFKLAGCPTGENQINAHQIHKILYERGRVGCHAGYVLAGEGAGDDRPLQPREILALLPADERREAAE